MIIIIIIIIILIIIIIIIIIIIMIIIIMKNQEHYYMKTNRVNDPGPAQRPNALSRNPVKKTQTYLATMLL